MLRKKYLEGDKSGIFRAETCTFEPHVGIHIDMTVPEGDSLHILPPTAQEVATTGFEVCAGHKEACQCPFWTLFTVPTSIPGVWSNETKFTCTYPPNWKSMPPFSIKTSSAPDNKQPKEAKWIPISKVTNFKNSIRLHVDVGNSPHASPLLKNYQPIYAVRYAWKTNACCDFSNPIISEGKSPCPLMNCGLVSKKYELVPDPFFAVIKENNHCELMTYH
mmetsp:Transcript_17516/g.27407  ORF Transcript_17516/g.27407 Transcript_17516/m.27407 type:complete len:219 (-) Transcript_17516:146-802(-)